jgi:hypothetical protein
MLDSQVQPTARSERSRQPNVKTFASALQPAVPSLEISLNHFEKAPSSISSALGS